MATETKNSFGAKFMNWYESYNGKRITAVVYSAGASVVIIGALFKILHWPGASYVLMVGMFTEAFLFLIGVLDKPHPEYAWGNVFPQLLEEGTEPERLERAKKQACPTLLGGSEAADANGVKTPALSEKDMENLKATIEGLSKTAGQMTDLTKAAVATAKLGEKAEAAAEAADKYAAAATLLGDKSAALSASYAEVEKNVSASVAGTKAYGEAVAAAAKSAVQWSNDVQSIQAAAAATAKDAEAAKAAQAKLAKQIADLNNIYGNMLNAVA